MSSKLRKTNWASTYQVDFGLSGHSFLPPLKHSQGARLNPPGGQGGKLQPRCFPISFPRFPKRPRDGKIPIALGFETACHRVDQIAQGIDSQHQEDNTVQSTTVKVNEHPEDDTKAVIEEIVNIALYTPSSKLDAFSLPRKCGQGQPRLSVEGTANLKPREKRSEDIPQRPVVHESKPERWQQIGTYWDKAQTRAGCEEPIKSRSLEPSQQIQVTNTANTRLLHRQQIQHANNWATPARTDKQTLSRPKSRKTVRFDNAEQLHNIPGYGGYKPLLPVAATSNDQATSSSVMQSIAQRTYRTFPEDAYKAPNYGRTGPLSRTVTLTMPFNPFNKINSGCSVMP